MRWRARLMLGALVAHAVCMPPQLTAGELQTEPGAPVGCLELGGAINLALARDYRIQRAAALRDAATARVDVERAAGRPQVSTFIRSGLGNGAGIRADNEFDNRVGVRGSQLLFDFGRTGLAVSAARQRALGEQEKIRLAQFESAFEVGQRLVAMARSSEKIDATAAIKSYYERDASQVNRRLEFGLLKASEASGIRAEYARAAARDAEQRLRLEQERAALASLVGQTETCVAHQNVERALRTAQPGELALAIDEAEQVSPVLASRRLEIEAAQLDARRAGRENLPSIALSGTSAFDFNSGFNDRPQSRIGFDVSTPIYQGGEVGARTRIANAETRMLEAEYSEERRLLSDEVTLSWLRVRDLAAISQLNDANRLALAEQAAATEREYAQGLVTLTELIDIRRNEYEGKIAEIDARHDLLIERLRLLHLTGRLIEGR